MLARSWRACAGCHSLLPRLHVIAREVIFVDLSLAQMAGLGSVVALLYGVAPDSRTAFISPSVSPASGPRCSR